MAASTRPAGGLHQARRTPFAWRAAGGVQPDREQFPATVIGFTHIVVLAVLHGALREVADEVGRHGYLILFALIAAESFGLPLPGEVGLLVGAYEVQRGAFSLPLVIVVGIAAAVSGDNLAFLVGRLAGRLMVERLMRLVRVPPAYLERMDSYYLRHAGWTIVIARQISPARGLAAFSAGGSRMPWRRFAVFNAAACVVWATVVTLLATLFVTHLDDLADDLSLAGLGALGLVAIVGVVYLWRRVRRGAGHGADEDSRRGDEPLDSS